MKKNDGVLCSVQSADRDEDHFKDPQDFDIYRDLSPEDTLGFGWAHIAARASGSRGPSLRKSSVSVLA